MAEKWSDDVPDEAFLAETDRLYILALTTLKRGLSRGLDFDQAASGIKIEDPSLRQSVLDDVLKVVIAEEHFAAKTSLEALGSRLNLPVELLEKARAEMLEDVEKAAVDRFYDNIEKGTEH